MTVRDELRDPWGWLVAGVSGGLGWAVLATPLGPAAVAVGAGIGAAVLATKVAVGAARGGEGGAGAEVDRDRPRDRLPEAPRGTVQRELQARSVAAVDRLTDLADRPSDQWIAGEVRSVLTESRRVVGSVREMAGRVTVLDNSIAAARPEALTREMAELQARLARTTDPNVRSEQERTLAALDAQADSVDRLLRRRDTLLAQMQSATVGLEGLAARAGELVALGPASHDTDEATRIVTDLTSSLDGVRAGVEEARQILRDL
jgi:hypothetical protein